MTARHVYVDTCAFMRFAEGAAAEGNSRNSTGRANVEALIDDVETILSTSEVAIIEFQDALGRVTRDGTRPLCDEAWFEKSVTDVMRLVAEDRLILAAVPSKAIEHAIMLMTIAHREHGIAFHAWDAVHLITATAWAVDVGEKVELATCDTDFTRFIERFPYFGDFVDIVMVA